MHVPALATRLTTSRNRSQHSQEAELTTSARQQAAVDKAAKVLDKYVALTRQASMLGTTVSKAKHTVAGDLERQIVRSYRAFTEKLSELQIEWTATTSHDAHNPEQDQDEEGYVAIANVWSALSLQIDDVLTKANDLEELCASIELKREEAVRKLNHQRLSLSELDAKSREREREGFRRIDGDFQAAAPSLFSAIEAFIKLTRYAEALVRLEQFDTKRKAIYATVDELPARRLRTLVLAEATRRQWCPIKIAMASAKAELRAIKDMASVERRRSINTQFATACAMFNDWRKAADGALEALSFSDEGQRWDEADSLLATAQILHTQILINCTEVKDQAKTIREEVEARTKLIAANAQVNLDTLQQAMEGAISLCGSLSGGQQVQEVLAKVREVELAALSDLLAHKQLEAFELKLRGTASALRILTQKAYTKHNFDVRHSNKAHVTYRLPTLTYHRPTGRIIGVLVGAHLEEHHDGSVPAHDPVGLALYNLLGPARDARG
jgi:hypothetical protein